MKCAFLLIFILPVFLLTAEEKCNLPGFWEGPHPTDQNIKFVFHFFLNNNKDIQCKGYWINKSLFNSEFDIDSVTINKKFLSLYIPSWECYYKGIINKGVIKGQFICSGEHPDSVTITRNDSLGNFVFFPIAEMSKPDFSYKHNHPKFTNKEIKLIDHYQNKKDSIFIYNTVNEIIQKQYGRINSYLIVKDKHLICEEYFYGYNRNTIFPIESTTKSITSLIVGIAVDKGYIESIETPVFNYFPEYNSLKSTEKEKITLKHLLTMSAGFKEDMDKILHSDDRNYYCLSRTLYHKPGETFSYDGGSTQVLAGIIKNTTGDHIDKFGSNYLFKELNITHYNWETYKQNGYPLTGGSLEMRPIDMAKIGLFILNNGKWNNKQIISEKWIKKSTYPWIKTNIDNDKYGYHWWISSINSGNKNYQLIWANGWGSQFIFILPELDMVIVTTGSNHQYGSSWDILEMLKKNLLIYNE